jgi:cell division protein FtsW (lipid II flippase)
MKKSNYTTFILMLACSAISMYITMYFNTYEFSHVFFSWTRMYMTLIGISAMAIIMFLFMKKMYENKKKNIAIIVGSLLLMSLSTFLVRQQIPINDVKWMRAMIPHHSIAILTSKKADLNDPEVIKLSEEIIKAQEREIAEMKRMINRLENK